jgi:hypothetical protein
VTGRIRRVFTFSELQFRRFMTFVRPDYLFLNFWNYFDGCSKDVRAQRLWSLKSMAVEHGSQLRLIGKGPTTTTSLTSRMKACRTGWACEA